MKLKTATRIAIYGTLVSVIMAIAYDYVGPAIQSIPNGTPILLAYSHLMTLIGRGGLLVFLCVLASKQKD